jgi:hypothetical protein
VLKLWLCGFNAYICGRVFGMRATTAMIPAVAWMLSGYNTTWAYWADPDVAAWLPLQLVSAEFLIRGHVRRGTALMAFASALMLLAGHPESAFTMSAGTGLYFFARLIWSSSRLRAIGCAALAWAAALAITAPQTLPFIEYLPESQTFNSRPDEGGHDLHFFPAETWVTLFVPRFYGSDADGNFWTSAAENQNFIIMGYAGITVWVLALGALAMRRPTLLGVPVALTIPAVLSLGMAMNMPGINLLYELPLLNVVWGCWFLGFPLFALALLAGLGWNRITEGGLPINASAIAGALIALVALMIGATYAFNASVMRGEDVFSFVTVQVIAAVLFLIATLAAISAGPRMTAVMTFVVITLVAGDLLWAARNLHPSSPHKQILFETNLTNVLKREPDRIHDAHPPKIPSGLLQAYGIEQLWGYDGIMPVRMWRFLGEVDRELAVRMAGVRYVLKPVNAEPKGLPLDGVSLHEYDDRLPRAFLSASIVRVQDESELFARMADEGFDPEAMVLTTTNVSLDAAKSGDLGEATLISRTPNEVTIDVVAAETCALVLSDAYYPGWNAAIDDEPVQIFPAYHAFRGIVVPPGKHRVVFKYEPASFRYGVYAAFAAMLATFIVAPAILIRRSAS